MKISFIQVNRNVSVSNGPEGERKMIVMRKYDAKTHKNFASFLKDIAFMTCTHLEMPSK